MRQVLEPAFENVSLDQIGGIKNYSKSIEDVFAVIACWLVFGETPTTAAAVNVHFKFIYIK